MASNRMLALLGLLAVAGFQNRDKLAQIIGNITGQNAPPRSPNDPSGTITNTRPAGVPSANTSASVGRGGDLGGLLGNLGGLFGGTAAAGGIGGALNDLLEQFSSKGYGDAARSWIQTGPNSDVRPNQLEEALGEDTLRELSAKTGLSRQELVERLTSVLPSAVDTLTPEGRLPTREEADRWEANARRFAA
jgi:uncharacterized protein YidB (DUF937 family)